jgi:Secretion system C-terminal sorting domain
MKKYLLVICFVLGVASLKAQVNLVVNPSFEDTVNCPLGPDEMYKCAGWSSYKASPDYYHAGCPMSVPNNWAGYQQAASGNAYCGIITKVSLSPNYREHIGSMLTTPLLIGTKYFVSFKVVLSIDAAFSTTYATNKTGAMFSTIPYTFSNPSPLNNHPQIFSDSIITDTLNWTRIVGSFISDSAYNYIILGNFFDDNHTDSLRLTGGMIEEAYYYLDDICVSTDSSFCNNYVYNGINETNQHPNISIYPNPATNELQITSYELGIKTMLTIYNVLGCEILKQVQNDKSATIDVSDFAKGVYFVEVQTEKGIQRKKFVKE